MTGPQGPAGRGRLRAGHLRAGHADREQVIEALKDAFVHDRLTRDELDARAGRALAAWTRAELAALTADIPLAPVAARAGPARARPLPLVKAAAAVRLAGLADPGPPDPTPYHSLAPLCFLIAFSAVLAALGFIVHGVGTSWEQRRSGRQVPPPPGPGGHALDGGQGGGAAHGPVRPGSATPPT
jgi:Domain of unknown function (DUF1707)